jgi:hypothetical protein
MENKATIKVDTRTDKNREYIRIRISDITGLNGNTWRDAGPYEMR